MLFNEERDLYCEHNMKHVNKNYEDKTESFTGKSDFTCNSLLAAKGLVQREGCK
jgi:hypothetical protein